MHGLIFVTWEKYLSERFGASLLSTYRSSMNETAATLPLASHVYDDATLVAGVGLVCKLTGMDADVLLREYGRYFQINGLTNHFCSYVVDEFQSGRDLLLAMGAVHAQLKHVHSGVTPPLFTYETSPNHPRGLILIYDSPRQLCPVLLGAIEGAAERYGETVQVVERACQKRGDPSCRIEAVFTPVKALQEKQHPTSEQQERRTIQKRSAHLILSVLPLYESGAEGMTLDEIQAHLKQLQVHPHHLRPAVILDALLHLSYAGLVANDARQLSNELTKRRYWRASLSKEGPSAHRQPPSFASAPKTFKTGTQTQPPPYRNRW